MNEWGIDGEFYFAPNKNRNRSASPNVGGRSRQWRDSVRTVNARCQEQEAGSRGSNGIMKLHDAFAPASQLMIVLRKEANGLWY